MSSNLDQLALQAKNGSNAALEQIVRELQDRMHHLSMRMLVNPDYAL